MNNKGPILIAYLSQIILVIILLQVTGFLKGLTVFVVAITEILILASIAKEKKWDFQSWYAFFMFIVILLFLIASLQSGISDITPTLSVEIIVALILGFFITVFSREPEEKPTIEITDIEPVMEVIHYRKPEAKEVIEEQKTETKKAKKKIKKKTIQKTISEKIVALKGSTTYHLSTCGYLKKAKKKDLKSYNSRRQATAMGLTKCNNCMG